MYTDKNFILQLTPFGNILLRYNLLMERFEYFCNSSVVSMECLNKLSEKFTTTFAFINPSVKKFVRIGRLADAEMFKKPVDTNAILIDMQNRENARQEKIRLENYNSPWETKRREEIYKRHAEGPGKWRSLPLNEINSKELTKEELNCILKTIEPKEKDKINNK